MYVERGDIWIVDLPDSVGCEQRGTRPAIVVSNDYANEYSPVIEIVFLTSKNKKPLPTHVVMDNKYGTAICEQIHSVDKSRLIDYKGKCTDKEMMRVNRALMISLGIIM